MRADWERFLPVPILEDAPAYRVLYDRAWALARDHVREIAGMPQSPYMDEAFCDTQIWIWDTCFMSLFCKYAGEVFPGVESLRNFYEVLYGEARLPTVIPSMGEPEWTGAVAGEPHEVRIHIADNPPLFAWAEYENALFHGDTAYIRELLYQKRFLQRHYEWIESLRERTTPRGVQCETRLVRDVRGYLWEGGRSGMDNTPRGRRGPRTDRTRPNTPELLWIDALCQQALSARMIASLFDIVGDTAMRDAWEEKYREKEALVNRCYWDAEDCFYYDIDKTTGAPCRVMTVASYWALTAGVATKERAAAMAERLSDERTLGGVLPLISLARNDGNYEPDGRYWRGGLWLPTAYAALKGLSAYGYDRLAHNASRAILDHMVRTYREYEPHTIWECYAPEAATPSVTADGRERVRPDFCGWSALGPIAIYIEFVLGFRRVDAFRRVVEWAKPEGFAGEIGICNLRFGDVVTDIVAKGGICTVRANAPYTLRIDGRDLPIRAGEQTLDLNEIPNDVSL